MGLFGEGSSDSVGVVVDDISLIHQGHFFSMGWEWVVWGG